MKRSKLRRSRSKWNSIQAQHGWCVPDMPMQANGQSTYNKVDAEKAWGKLLALYKAVS